MTIFEKIILIIILLFVGALGSAVFTHISEFKVRNQNEENMSLIKVDMSLGEVLGIMGQPDGILIDSSSNINFSYHTNDADFRPFYIEFNEFNKVNNLEIPYYLQEK